MPPRRRLTATGSRLLLSAVVVAAGAPPALAAAPVDLLSYRAAYRLSLDHVERGAGLESVRGALVLEWRADCTGWLSQQRINYVAKAGEGQGFTQDVRFSSWEAPDYTRLRRWAHQYGYGGHISTKSRAFSVTLGFLRHQRTIWRRTEGHPHTYDDEQADLVVYRLGFHATGWITTGDALLANSAADAARRHADAPRDHANDDITVTALPIAA